MISTPSEASALISSPLPTKNEQARSDTSCQTHGPFLSPLKTIRRFDQAEGTKLGNFEKGSEKQNECCTHESPSVMSVSRGLPTKLCRRFIVRARRLRWTSHIHLDSLETHVRVQAVSCKFDFHGFEEQRGGMSIPHNGRRRSSKADLILGGAYRSHKR